MPASDSLGRTPLRPTLVKDYSGNYSISMLPLQRKRSTLDSAYTINKENSPLGKQKRGSSIRRPKYSRLSDRWPVLSKIMRSNKSVDTSPNTSSDTHDYDLLDDEDSNVLPIEFESCRFSGPVVYRQHVSHPASPKFPSPLSGVCPVKRLLLPRHNYPHRGYSQSGLYLQRDLWRRRKFDWDDYEYVLSQSGITLEDAYGGMVNEYGNHVHSLPSHLRNCPWEKRSSSLSRSRSESNLNVPVFLNYATFPRLGDLSAIRDPFLTSVDTWFAEFPLWTLSKLIWMYDVNYRSGDAVLRCKPIWDASTLKGSFARDDSSEECLSVSDADSSDLTLVDTSPVLSYFPRDKSRSPTRTHIAHGKEVTSRASQCSLHSTETRSRPWEICWMSRWEVLYDQVSLAADLVAAGESPSSSINASKEAVRILLTTPHVLHDPNSHATEMQGDYNRNQLEAHLSSSRTYTILPAEDDEEDYGRIIPLSESVYRLGAQVDPFSMFATATPEHLDISGSADGFDVAATYAATEYASQIAAGLHQLEIYS